MPLSDWTDFCPALTDISTQASLKCWAFLALQKYPCENHKKKCFFLQTHDPEKHIYEKTVLVREFT